jgi:hypothetical protein
MAHKHSDFQKEILRSEKCGCFYCLEIFSPDEITDWHGEDCKEYEPLWGVPGHIVPVPL